MPPPIRLRPDGTPYPYDVRQAQIHSQRRGRLMRGIVMPVAAIGAAAAAPAVAGMFGGGGAAAGGGGAAASGTGYSSPGIFGGVFGGGGGAAAAPSALAPTVARTGFSLGSMLNSPATGLGVNFLTSWLGNRSASRANAANLQAQLEAAQRAEELQRQSLAESSRQFDVSQGDSRAALAAQNELRRRELAAAEEERAFARRLVEEREQRMAPYRERALRWSRTLDEMLRRG